MNKKQNSLMRFSRTERLAQLSEQEIVIERKKKEIQAKLEAQKKKQTEETLRKLESSKEIKNKPEFSKKSSWSKVQVKNNTIKEKPVKIIKESLTNAFSNDGSFLDHFKKLSQTGFPANDAEMQACKKGEKSMERDHESVNDNNPSSQTKKALDSNVQFQIPPPGVVELVPQHHNALVKPHTVDGPVIPLLLDSTSQLQGMNSIQRQTFHSDMQLNSSQSNHLSNKQPVFQGQCSTPLQQDSKSSLTSIQSPLSITPQNIPTPSFIQVNNISPAILSNKLPKVRSESISMTLKVNPIRKLDAIPNPLEVNQLPSPPSAKKSQFSFSETKETSEEPSFITKKITGNVSSQDRESSRVSSAFFDNDQDGEEDGDLLGEKYHRWAEFVAHYGDNFEESLRNQNHNDPDIRFLLDKNSKEYLLFRKLVLSYQQQLQSSEEEYSEKKQKLDSPNAFEGFSKERNTGSESGWQKTKTCSKSGENEEDCLLHSQMSESIPKDDCFSHSRKEYFPEEISNKSFNEKNVEQYKAGERRKRKRKSRWEDAVPTTSTPNVSSVTLHPPGKLPPPKSTLLSQLTRSDPGLIQYARQTFGSSNLSEEDWKKAEDHYKINLLYQDMVKKRAEVEKLEKQGKFKYEYDSDEDTEGGTWEHKLRQQEMQATQLWAEELTRQAAGKHHIGDFLPPEELERFMEKYNAVKEGREPDLSDYKEYKLKEDNIGYRLLQKMGWNEGQGLGQDGSGIVNPVNKATSRHENQGLGIERNDGLEPGDDEYDAYRKRMMLAYRFRPNPLNNPRRPYY